MLSYKRITRLFKGYGKYYFFAVICAALGVTFYMIRPIILKITIDNVIDDKPMDAPAVFGWLTEKLGGTGVLAQNLWICGIGMVLSISLFCLFIFLRDRLASLSSEGFAADLKDKLYIHLQNMPYDYHVNAKTGDLIQRCTSDVETVRRFLATQLIAIARILFTVIIAVSVMFSANVPMTLISVAVTPFLFIFSYTFFMRIKRNFKISDEKEGELSALLQENLTGVRVVRAFGKQKYELEKFTEKNDELSRLNFRLIRLLAGFWSVSDVLISVQIAVVLFAGVYMVNSGAITLGTLILFITYEGSLLWPIRQLGRVLSDFGKTQIALGRIFEILDAREEQYPPDALRPPLNGDIVFKHVDFEYEKGKRVLDDVSFEIKSGETIAVLGTTGSGKSTLSHLLLRLYDYKAGSITIGGTELNRIDKKWLREHIGMVLQEPFLFSKTIKENIRMANAIAEDEDIDRAAETAAALEFIEGFEKGWDTMVGERGVTLSGGQKQRVAIARTLVKNSSVLIFDDSLSAVDTETDARIRAALKERQKGVTTIIISQRITTLMQADRILVFENGRLTDSGPHAELIARDGLYSRIWGIQNMLEEDLTNENGA